MATGEGRPSQTAKTVGGWEGPTGKIAGARRRQTNQRSQFELGDHYVTEETPVLLVLSFEDSFEQVDLFTKKASENVDK